jgi:PAS domain S-box-containing protein
MKTNPPVSVLVVDDDAIVRDSMGAYLGNRGYSVLKAACGDEGLELFAREQPDIVLLDLRMPGMDGLDVLGHLSREAPDTPVIVISGMGVVGDVVEALRRGAWDYLVKPVRDLRVLVSAMERCLERAALLRERVAREQRLEDLVALRTAELEESNARLSESEARYRRIYESLQNVYSEVRWDGTIVEISPSCDRVFGAPPSGLIGHSMLEFYTDPAQRDRVLGELAAKGRVDDAEIDLRRPDGQVLTCSLTAELHRDAEGNPELICGTCHDISARKRAEQDLVRLARAVDQAGDVTVLTDAEGVIEYANLAFERLTGVSRSGAAGRHFLFPVVEDHSAAYYEGIMRGIETEGGWKGRLVFRSADGRESTTETVVSAVRDPAGRLIQCVLVARDVTRELALEERLRQVQKLEAIGVLAGGIAHDFNNILYGLIGYAELAQDEALPGSPLAQSIDQVLLAGRRAKELVHRILTFSRGSSQELKARQLTPVVTEACRLLEGGLPRQISLHTDLVSRWTCLCDETQVHQVVMNLCTNAVHAMEDRGGILIVRLEDQMISAQEVEEQPGLAAGDHVVLTVSDSGHGIEPHHLPRVFDPFFSTKPQGKGTGMGLSMVHGIVQSLGGSVTVESREGRGSTFRVYLPRSAVADSLSQDDRTQVGSGRSVLLVEADAGLAELTERSLSGMGAAVVVASTVEAAVNLIRTRASEWDLVLTTLELPDGDGLELVRELRRRREDAVVVLTTAFTSELDLDVPARYGVRDILTRPVLRSELARVLADLPRRPPASP